MSWIHSVKKKTARLSTRITASLGLINLTRDEEFEKHYGNFKHIEKTIGTFIKNLTTFVEHLENFLVSLQATSENLSYLSDRDKSLQKEAVELKKKNKALACEHFHDFKRTIDRQVVAVTNQLLQKFSGPHRMIRKRSAKLLDYAKRTREMESCNNLDKEATIRDQYVIAKDVYDRINRQLIDELALFNRFALDIFRQCILILLENRKNLINSYTKQTSSLLNTPLMMTYTASNVVSSVLMSCPDPIQNIDISAILEQEQRDSGHTSGQDVLPTNDDDDFSCNQSSASRLSSDFYQMALEAREISSTPMSHFSEYHSQFNDNNNKVVAYDEPDAGLGTSDGLEVIKAVQTLGNMRDSNDEAESIEKVFTRERRRKRKPQICIASWPFVATGPNQLTIASDQILKLVKDTDECGNPDWSLVQDKRGQMGYVPTSYLKRKSDLQNY